MCAFLTALKGRVSSTQTDEKHFASREEAFEHYETTRAAYKDIKPPKRGGSKESKSDWINLFRRRAIDVAFSNDGNLRASWREAVAIWRGRCYICDKQLYDARTGEQLVPSGHIQADHIVDPMQGGTISAGNMAPACPECNSKKSDTPYQEFFKDKPETIAKIKSYQKYFSYEPPSDQNLVKAVRERIDAMAEDMQSELETLIARAAEDLEDKRKELLSIDEADYEIKVRASEGIKIRVQKWIVDKWETISK